MEGHIAIALYVENFSIQDMAADAAAVIKHVFPQQRANVFGTSMGGMIVQCIALLIPERVKIKKYITHTTHTHAQS